MYYVLLLHFEGHASQPGTVLPVALFGHMGRKASFLVVLYRVFFGYTKLYWSGLVMCADVRVLCTHLRCVFFMTT